MRRVFPPAEGRYTFGPMVRIAWGADVDHRARGGGHPRAAGAAAPGDPRPAQHRRCPTARARWCCFAARRRHPRLRPRRGLGRRQPVRLPHRRVPGRPATWRSGWAGRRTRRSRSPPAGSTPASRSRPGSRRCGACRSRWRWRQPAAAGDRVLRADLDAASSSAVASTCTPGWTRSWARSVSTARASIDALIGEPFGFLLDLSIAVDICLDDIPLLHAALKVSLEGTAPVARRTATAEIAVLFFKAEIGFDVTFGEPARTGPGSESRCGRCWPTRSAAMTPGRRSGPPPARWTSPCDDSRRRTTCWSTRSDGSRCGSGHCRWPPRSPGSAPPCPTAPTPGSRSSPCRSGALAAGPAGLRDDFAVPQFVDLTDDQRLSRPAFEPLPAGAQRHRARVPAAGRQPRRVIGVDAEPVYDDAIIDVTDTGQQRRNRDPAVAQPTLEPGAGRAVRRRRRRPCRDPRRRRSARRRPGPAGRDRRRGLGRGPVRHPARPRHRRRRAGEHLHRGGRTPPRRPATGHRRRGEPVSTHTFLRWVRTGAAGAITETQQAGRRRPPAELRRHRWIAGRRDCTRRPRNCTYTDPATSSASTRARSSGGCRNRAPRPPAPRSSPTSNSTPPTCHGGSPRSRRRPGRTPPDSG